MRPKRAPTSAAGRGAYSLGMNDGIYFADAELPFHVWVRERAGAGGYKWVLREANVEKGGEKAAISDPKSASAGGQKPD